MDYKNPKIPEGINTSQENPLKEFAILSAGIIAIVVVVVLALSLAAEKLTGYIPFEMEQKLVEPYLDKFPDDDKKVTTYLQNMANRLAAEMGLPKNMSVTIHYANDETINAYATLGGQIVIYRGLIEKLPHENALAMVVAHEIGHIFHRDPIVAMGRGVVVGLTMASLAGLSGNNIFDGLVGEAGTLTMLTFNREQEHQADRAGLKAVQGFYGHVAGADDLFQEFVKLQGEEKFSIPAFMNSHPLSKDRLVALRRMAKKRDWPSDQPTTPLPKLLRQALSAGNSKSRSNGKHSSITPSK